MALQFVCFLSRFVHIKQPTSSEVVFSILSVKCLVEYIQLDCEMHQFPNTVFCLHFCFRIEKIAKGKKPCEFVDRFFGSTQKMLSKEANNFHAFYVHYI